jgi:competence transcription factor ComK
MEVVELIDYAHPAMMAEKAMKDLHEAMLEKKYDQALEFARKAQVEIKMTYNAILHEKDQANG